MKLKILLTGKNGQVGRALLPRLSALGEVAAFGREELDLVRPDAVREAIRSARPNLIVNAAAYTAVDCAESEESLARAVNAEAPGVMAAEAKKVGAMIVHYSTDYVFDGTKTEPYLETDATNPLNAYGRTKLAGEQAIRDSGAMHLIFRTAWVYDREGKNFLRTILRLATEKEELKIVRDQTGAPTSSPDIALATVGVLSQLYGPQSKPDAPSRSSGIYHMTAGGQTSWYEFAKAILEEAAGSPRDSWLAQITAQKPIITRSIQPISTAEYPTPARRPAYSVLSNQRLAREFGIRLQDWRTQLRFCFEGLQPALHHDHN